MGAIVTVFFVGLKYVNILKTDGGVEFGNILKTDGGVEFGNILKILFKKKTLRIYS